MSGQKGNKQVAIRGGGMQKLGLTMGYAAMIWAGSLAWTQEKAPAAASEKQVLNPETFLELRSEQAPQFSPDGTRVAMVVSDPFKGEKRTRHIWLYDKQRNTTRQLTFSEKSESSPRWSPDAKNLAFLSNRGDEQQI